MCLRQSDGTVGDLRDHIMEFLKKIICTVITSFGFINKRSTMLQLLKVINECTKLLDEGHCIDFTLIS